jgi:hypothetical protein
MAVSERLPISRRPRPSAICRRSSKARRIAIAVERMRFNETAQAFNHPSVAFPHRAVRSLVRQPLREKPYFQAAPGLRLAPKVKF